MNDTGRAALIENMAREGQALAVRWGHQPWSDSWAVQVAETMLNEVAPADWRCECGDLNREHEAFCYRCGAGQPEAVDIRQALTEALLGDMNTKKQPKFPLKGVRLWRWRFAIRLHRIGCWIGGNHAWTVVYDEQWKVHYCPHCGRASDH